MDSEYLTDAMVDYIRSAQNGVASKTLATHFLRFVNPNERLASLAVESILNKDPRCRRDENALWYVNRHCQDDQPVKPLISEALAVVYVITTASNLPERSLYLCIWSCGTSVDCLLSCWLADPDTLSFEEQELLRSNHDEPFSGIMAPLPRIVSLLQDKTVVFLSYKQQLLVERLLATSGEMPTDDVLLISAIARVADVVLPKSLSLETAYQSLFNRNAVLTAAFRYGESFAECSVELFGRLKSKGITTREAFDNVDRNLSTGAPWTEATFSLNTILSLSQQPGVYGFRNRDTRYIYIGKAKNMKRRLLSYFRETEESPEKIALLRKTAYTLTVSPCGSELESLLLEYRLIRKHDPVLNHQGEIYERKGPYTPLQDCIILLPHTEESKGMSLWLRRNQKILLKSFSVDFSDIDELRSQIKTFFFETRLPANNQDFPELEIVSRWVGNHEDSLCIVPVHRLSSVDEILKTFQNYWQEGKWQHLPAMKKIF